MAEQVSLRSSSSLAALAQCEATIERGLRAFVDVGQALLRIRDRRLYLETHETFEAYCRERWDLSRKRAYDLSAAAEVAKALSPMGDKPDTERVARELAPLRDTPERLREAWSQVVAQHGDRPTARQVREIVVQHNGDDAGAIERLQDLCPTCGGRIPSPRALSRRAAGRQADD